jgi:hypothetical protein
MCRTSAAESVLSRALLLVQMGDLTRPARRINGIVVTREAPNRAQQARALARWMGGRMDGGPGEFVFGEEVS